MLSTDEFKTFAGNVVLFLHNTSKVEGEPWCLSARIGGGFGGSAADMGGITPEPRPPVKDRAPRRAIGRR